MNIYELMSESPYLAFFLALILGTVIVRITVTLPCRILKHRNILKHGYPPAHCDANGDFRKMSEEEERAIELANDKLEVEIEERRQALELKQG